MTLPIDPAAIDPDEYGEQQTTLAMAHEAAIEYVREVCLDNGFGVPVEFSPSEMLNAKVDADRDPYYVLGACNPRWPTARSMRQTGGSVRCFPAT
ncbi:MAG: hypothetical protein J07HN6_00906 [Halonotius sp. J07HN6]|nr:MAG: hypothetical protein J07HN6_00906 [Halonotius sp. J07HN6]